ncbi:MAG: hypothetical protein WA916_01875 [Arcobacter sp.]|uniref:hypothetical protein n=1 Tax=Arcobacter sp. TaxID=1872629 RepID=UPI003C758719
MIQKLYKYLSTPEKSGKKIGIFRTITSIFGGLIVAYLGMTLLAFLIPLEVQKSGIISIMFNTLTWAIATVYIGLSYTKWSALLRFMIPTIIFSLALFILY